MTKRKHVPVPEFVPQGCVLLDEFLDHNKRTIAVGDVVRVQFVKYGDWSDATVNRIVANETTREVRDVTIITIGAHKQFRTVVPEKLRRLPRQGDEVMKLSEYKGDMPTNQQGGRVRKATPFDDVTVEYGTHKVQLEKDDNVKTIVSQIRNAAKLNGNGVRVIVADDEKSILFAVKAKKARKTTAVVAA